MSKGKQLREGLTTACSRYAIGDHKVPHSGWMGRLRGSNPWTRKLSSVNNPQVQPRKSSAFGTRGACSACPRLTFSLQALREIPYETIGALVLYLCESTRAPRPGFPE